VLLALAEDVGVGRLAVRPWVAAAGLVAAQAVAVSWVQYFRYFLRSARGDMPAEGEAAR
jgi:hypothetical protein